jgi:GNAT superfamily N-acetyltransferase
MAAKFDNQKLLIKKMGEDDIEFAHRLTVIEDWGYLEDDFRRLLSWEQDGCFVAEYNNQPVGIISTTTYDDYAFIGTLIVIESMRGKGIGELLTRTAIDCLKGKSIKTIELDGVIPAVSLYRRLGFKDKYLSLRFKRPALSAVFNKSYFNPKLDDVLDFDRKITGLNRERMIRTYFETISENIIAVGSEKISAYAIVRPRYDGSYTIGPVVGINANEVENLIKVIIGKFGNNILTIGVPAINLNAVKLFSEYGFLYTQPSLRMCMGEKRYYESNIFGIFSAEKG